MEDLRDERFQATFLGAGAGPPNLRGSKKKVEPVIRGSNIIVWYSTV